MKCSLARRQSEGDSVSRHQEMAVSSHQFFSSKSRDLQIRIAGRWTAIAIASFMSAASASLLIVVNAIYLYIRQFSDSKLKVVITHDAKATLGLRISCCHCPTPGATGEGFGPPVFNVSGQFTSLLSSDVERLYWGAQYRHSWMAVQCHRCLPAGVTGFEPVRGAPMP